MTDFERQGAQLTRARRPRHKTTRQGFLAALGMARLYGISNIEEGILNVEMSDVRGLTERGFDNTLICLFLGNGV